MQDLLLFLTQSLVEDRDAVRVEELEEDGDLIYEITVDQDDLGRVIGRGGRVANAIRTLAAIAKFLNDRSVRERLGTAPTGADILAVFEKSQPA